MVEALIGSESSFHSDAKNNNARGLMQITDSTLEYMNDQKELKNYLIKLNKKEIFDPNYNICAGVRWLFRKKQIAEYNGKMTWFDSIQEYKGYNSQDDRGMKNCKELYEKIKGQP